MQSDIKLKIRHAKRGNETKISLAGMQMTELPLELTQLTMLEELDVSNNKLINLRKIEQLPNLRKVNAANNNIQQLHPDMLDMYSIDSIILTGNPIVNSNPQLAKIENDGDLLKKAMEQSMGMASNAHQGLSSLGGGTYSHSNFGMGAGA